MRSMLLALVFGLVVSGCVDETPAGVEATGQASPRIVVGAIGNSLMLGYNADEDHIESAPEIAWATGDAAWSFRARIGAVGVENVAAPGAGADEFLGQIAGLKDATLVLVLLMDSAMCGPPSGASPGDFEAQLREGTRALLGRGMTPMLLTPPDIVAVGEAARAKPPANDFVLTYAMGQECALEPGVEERQTAMFATIGRVAEEEEVLHDHGALSRIRWEPDMVSDVDGLHPSPLGLQAIADAVWDAYGLSAGRRA